jgi:hypothetical protein
MLKIKLLDLTKILAKKLVLQRAFSSSAILKESLSGDRSSLTLQSESETCP